VATGNTEVAEGTEGEAIHRTGGDNKDNEDAAKEERKTKEVDAQKGKNVSTCYGLVLIILNFLDNAVFRCFHAYPPDPED
jgi:hypothetical protein